MSDFLITNEPIRFTNPDLDRVLLHCVQNDASDITFQTNSPVIAEIHGRIHPRDVTKNF